MAFHKLNIAKDRADCPAHHQESWSSQVSFPKFNDSSTPIKYDKITRWGIYVWVPCQPLVFLSIQFGRSVFLAFLALPVSRQVVPIRLGRRADHPSWTTTRFAYKKISSHRSHRGLLLRYANVAKCSSCILDPTVGGILQEGQGIEPTTKHGDVSKPFMTIFGVENIHKHRSFTYMLWDVSFSRPQLGLQFISVLFTAVWKAQKLKLRRVFCRTRCHQILCPHNMRTGLQAT